MKINFNGKNNENENKVEVGRGGYEGMLALRKKKLPEMQEAVRDILDGWDGELITIIVSKEDENGMPTGSHIVSMGCSRMEANVAHTKSIDKASRDMIDQIVSGVAGDSEAMATLFKSLVDSGIFKEDK
jgi:hypothetical protein